MSQDPYTPQIQGFVYAFGLLSSAEVAEVFRPDSKEKREISGFQQVGIAVLEACFLERFPRLVPQTCSIWLVNEDMVNISYRGTYVQIRNFTENMMLQKKYADNF